MTERAFLWGVTGHSWLAAFAPGCGESCEKLSAMLDGQHTKIWPEFEILRSFRRYISTEAHPMFAAGSWWTNR